MEHQEGCSAAYLTGQGCPEVGAIGAEVAVLLTQVQMQAKKWA